MRPIPIDVLRAFVAVVDEQGFTRAAESLGRTQPTVSLQVKRLEEIVDTPLFERAIPLTLTPMGELCLSHGRKVLAAHDLMTQAIVAKRSSADPARFGAPREVASLLSAGLANIVGEARAAEQITLACETSEDLLVRFRARSLDIALALTTGQTARGAIARWTTPMTWVCAPGYVLPSERPIPLITFPQGSICFRLAAKAMGKARREFAVVCESPDFEALRAAIIAGRGVCPLPKWLVSKGMRRAPSSQIAALPDIELSLFASAGFRRTSPALLDDVISLVEEILTTSAK